MSMHNSVLIGKQVMFKGCKFEGGHPVVYGQLFIVLLLSLHNI